MFFTHIDNITQTDRGSRQARCIAVDLVNTPPLLDECFQLLQASGAIHFALFGGAIRDADYGTRHSKPYHIKDYDLRVWLPEHDYDQQTQLFVTNLEQNTGLTAQEIPSPGTGRIRYCLNYAGVEFDISVRPIPEAWRDRTIPPEAVAIDRACDSDAGICSVAIDSQKQAWAMPEYMLDQTRKTLTIYPNPDAARKHAYAKRMKSKFPDHNMIELYTSQRAGEIGVSTELNHATIYTRRLKLTSINQHEKSYLTETYNKLFKNPLNTSMFCGGLIWTDEEINALIENKTQLWNSGNRLSAFVVHNKETQAFIGSLFIEYSLDKYQRLGAGHANAAEIGYILDHSFRGNGYATEIAIAGKKYIKHIMHLLPFDGIEPPIKEIVATVHPDNKASRSILQKTLKKYERDESSERNDGYFEFKAYGNNPRNFFHKALKQDQHLVMASHDPESQVTLR